MLLHIEAFEHRYLFHTEAFTQRGFDIYTPMHTEAFRHRWFFRRITEALTQRSLYTENLLHTEAFTHTSFSTEAFTQRSFWARAFTHKTSLQTEGLYTQGFYAQKLLHREAFTHRRFPTEKLIPQSSFYTLSKSRNFTFFDVWPSYRAKGLHPALENRNSWRWTIILREMGCAWPCKIAFLHQFYFAWNSCAWRSKMDKVRNFTPILERLHLTLKKAQFSHSYCRLVFMPRLHLNFQNTPVFDGWPSFPCEGAAPGPAKFAFCHVFWMSDLRDLCLRRRLLRAPRTNKTRISPHVWVSNTPQRVTFRKPPPGCRCRQREIEELEKSDFAGVHIQFDHWKLAELLCSNSCATISVQMTFRQDSCRSSSRSGSPASQPLCKQHFSSFVGVP